MNLRPESMAGRGTTSPPPIPTTAVVSAQGEDPAKRANAVQLSFRPTDRSVVDRAVAAFVATLEAG